MITGKKGKLDIFKTTYKFGRLKTRATEVVVCS